MLAWSEGNGREKPEIAGYKRSVTVTIFWFTPRSPGKLVTLNPKLKSTGAGRYQLLSRWWDAYRKQQPEETSLRKVRTLWHCSRLRSVALYLWLIVVISVRQSDPLQQYLGFTAFLYGQFGLGQRRLKFKEAGGTVREIDVWAESPRLSPLWLSASSSACHGLLIITVITPLPTKPSATKMPENWSWRTRQLLTCRCVSVMLLRSMQNTQKS